MAINLSSLSTYVDEQRLPLIRKSVLGSKTAKMFNLQTGVKYESALNLLETSIVFGDGSSCGFEDAGSQDFSQRMLKAGMIKVNQSFCNRALLKYWQGYQVRVAAGDRSLPFEEEFVNGIIDGVNEALEKAVWQGDTSLTGSANANINKFDGICKIVEAADVSASVNVVTASSADTIVDRVFAVLNATPEALQTKNVIFMSYANFNKLVQQLTKDNLFHYAPVIDERMEIVLPGTTVRVVGVPGLSGINKIYSLNLDHTFYGCDLEGDEEKFDLWYSKDDQIFKLVIYFNAAVQIAFADEVVIGKPYSA